MSISLVKSRSIASRAMARSAVGFPGVFSGAISYCMGRFLVFFSQQSVNGLVKSPKTLKILTSHDFLRTE